MPNPVAQDTFIVRIPRELADDPSYDAGLLAIAEAEEAADTYCLPATWTSEFLRDDGFDAVYKVIRFRNG